MRGKVIPVFLALTLLATAGEAISFKRKVSTTRTQTFGLEKSGTGQTIVTVMWAKAGADLDILIECGDLGVTAVSLSSESRYENLSIGMADGQICTLSVFAFQGATTAYINIQASTGGQLGASAIRAVELAPVQLRGLRNRVESLRAGKARARD